MRALSADGLIKACAEVSQETGITIRSELEPAAGPGAPVKPATYEGGKFQAGSRWWGAGDNRRTVNVITIDNYPSQANWLEDALLRLRADLRLPEVILDLSGAGELPPHLPRKISSFRFPHRNADAYLRDSELGGVRFHKTEIGKEIFSATADNPESLFRWMPQALLFGFWQSHLGAKRSQAKLARVWYSEIVGVEPARDDVKIMGVKGDPLNLSIADKVVSSGIDEIEWDLAPKGERLSEIGHGQVPFPDRSKPNSGALAGVSFREIVQQSTVTFAGLRRVRLESGAAEGRALLAALGLIAHAQAFGGSFNLRSGCELRPMDAPQWIWLGASPTKDEVLEPLSVSDARSIFVECVERAEGAGLPVGSRWAEPLVVKPIPQLLEVIKKSWPLNDA